MPGKKVPKGMHRMPSGKLMRNSAMKPPRKMRAMQRMKKRGY